MTVGSISAASLGQYVLSSSQSNPLQQALESLQSSLGTGDLNGAQEAFQTLQNLNQSLENASGSNPSSNTQLSTDLTTLGSIWGGRERPEKFELTIADQRDKHGNSISATDPGSAQHADRE